MIPPPGSKGGPLGPSPGAAGLFLPVGFLASSADLAAGEGGGGAAALVIKVGDYAAVDDGA